MENKINRKGEMTSQTLIWTIIVIVGFLIVLLVFWQLNWSGTIDKEVCHQSVIYRATLPSTFNLNQYVPLKCQTDKICITTGFIGGSCKDFEGVKGVTKVKVNSVQDIEKFLADQAIECWTTMGEGKVSLFTDWLSQSYGFKSVYPSCVVCNRIAYDSVSLEKAGIDPNKVDVESYMRSHILEGKEMTYFEYFGGSAQVSDKLNPGTISLNKDAQKKLADSIPSETKDTSTSPITESKLEIGKPKRNVDFTKDNVAIVFNQITAPSHGNTFSNYVNTVFGLVGLGATFAPKGTFFAARAASTAAGVVEGTTITYASSGAVIGTSGGAATAAGGAAITPVAIGVAAVLVTVGAVQQGNVYWQRSVTAGYCGDVSVGTDARNGCSSVRVVPYDLTSLNQYCGVIESIP